MVECRFPSDKAYPSELDNELPLKVNTDPLNFCSFCAFHELANSRMVADASFYLGSLKAN
jgi:hypothetical protein